MKNNPIFLKPVMQVLFGLVLTIVVNFYFPAFSVFGFLGAIVVFTSLIGLFSIICNSIMSGDINGITRNSRIVSMVIFSILWFGIFYLIKPTGEIQEMVKFSLLLIMLFPVIVLIGSFFFQETTEKKYRGKAFKLKKLYD